MKILIEEYQYNPHKIQKILSGIDSLENIKGAIRLNYVGYFYNPLINDCVFILPKVVLEATQSGQELVFGKYLPEDIIDFEKCNGVERHEIQFLYEFAIWIYRAVTVFKSEKSNDTTIVYQKQTIKIGKGGKKVTNTFLDILLALQRFNRENKDFVLFVLKNLHSGFNKINWNRTLHSSKSILQNNRPVYLNPVNKKRLINFDEELFVIYFSILNYINEKFGFSSDINCNFSLIKGEKFDHYLKGLGLTRLHRIKYKFFSDKALELWKLCYLFFEQAQKISNNNPQPEYLLVKNFNIVFETIIDELIGDQNIPSGLKEQDDGKRIDHLFAYESLTNPDSDIYYIGDSKYYKLNNEVSKESVFKQFTYARNVIQWNLDLWNRSLGGSGCQLQRVPKLRDDITEGYNIIPNFFISGKLNKALDYQDQIDVTNKKHQYFSQSHFENRLFDRDTLLVSHYDVNFLFVLALYGRNNKYQKEAWKNKVRKMFQTKAKDLLNSLYDFYLLIPKTKDDGELFIQQHFRKFLGKIFAPTDGSYFILALEKGSLGQSNRIKNKALRETNDELISIVRGYFDVISYFLGDKLSIKLHETFNEPSVSLNYQEPINRDIPTSKQVKLKNIVFIEPDSNTLKLDVEPSYYFRKKFGSNSKAESLYIRTFDEDLSSDVSGYLYWDDKKNLWNSHNFLTDENFISESYEQTKKWLVSTTKLAILARGGLDPD